jgi:hypothetical protein
MPSLRGRPQPIPTSRRLLPPPTITTQADALRGQENPRRPRRRWSLPPWLLSGGVSPRVAIARADTVDHGVQHRTNTEAPSVCSLLNDYPTLSAVAGVIQGLVEDDEFTPYQTGEVVTRSVANDCPRHVPLLQRFADTYTPKGQLG